MYASYISLNFNSNRDHKNTILIHCSLSVTLDLKNNNQTENNHVLIFHELWIIRYNTFSNYKKMPNI